MKVLSRIVDLVLGGVFIYAGVLKVLDPVGFANDIDNYKLLSWPVAVGLGFYLPWLEICCALGVILRRAYPAALSIIAGLLLVFLAATIAAKLRGLDISCGCFGHASQHWNFSAHLAVDLVLLGLALVLLRNAWRGASHRPAEPSFIPGAPA